MIETDVAVDDVREGVAARNGLGHDPFDEVTGETGVAAGERVTVVSVVVPVALEAGQANIEHGKGRGDIAGGTHGVRDDGVHIGRHRRVKPQDVLQVMFA